MPKIDYKVHAGMLLVAVLYGTNYAAVKTITPSLIDPFGFLIYRVGLAGLVFWILDLSNNQKINWSVDGIRIVGCAVLGVGINMLFFFKGLSLTSSIHGSIIMTMTPILIGLLAAVLLNERLSKKSILGLITGLIGALLIIFQANLGSSQASIKGDLFILMNALSYGAYLVVAKPILLKYKPLTLVKWFFFIGFIFILPFGFDQMNNISWREFSSTQWFSFLFVIFGVTVIAYITNIWAMKKVSPSVVGAYIYLQPVFASILGIGFLDERLTLQTIVGAVMVFVGVGLIIKKKRAKHVE